MNERQIPRWAMAALALVMLLGLGSLLYNSGYSSGMATGLLVSSSEGSAMNPYLLSRMEGMHGGFGFFGGLLRLGFFLIFLAVIAKFLGFARWKMRMNNGDSAGNGFHGPWGGHRGWHHGEQQETPVQNPAVAPAEKPAASAPPEQPVEKM